jgi:hypothetical protein
MLCNSKPQKVIGFCYKILFAFVKKILVFVLKCQI